MFFVSYKFHILKSCLTKINTILIFSFLICTQFIIYLFLAISSTVTIFDLSQAVFPIFIALCGFFIGTLNLLLIYNLYIGSKRKKILSLEKRSYLKNFDLFFVRYLACNTIIIFYILLNILFWTLGLFIFKPLSFNILLNIYTPGLFVLILYSLLFSGITIWLISFGKTKIVVIPCTLFSIYVGLSPLFIIFPNIMPNEYNNPNTYSYFYITQYLKYNELQISHSNGIVSNIYSEDDKNNSFLNFQINSEVENTLIIENILNDSEIQKLEQIISKSNDTQLWYSTGLFDQYSILLNEAIYEYFHIPQKYENLILFDINDSIAQKSFKYNFYNNIKKTMQEYDFQKGSSNNSMITSNDYNLYSAKGQLQDTLNFLKNESVFNEINTKFKNDAKINYSEWFQLLDFINQLFKEYYYCYNNQYSSFSSSNYLANAYSKLFIPFDDNYLIDDYWGLNLFTSILYNTISGYNNILNLQHFKNNGDSFAYWYNRFDFDTVLYNMIIYSGAKNYTDYPQIYNAQQNGGIYSDGTIFTIDYTGEILSVDCQMSNICTTEYQVKNVSISKQVWIGEWYIEIASLTLVITILAYFTYSRKIYQ